MAPISMSKSEATIEIALKIDQKIVKAKRPVFIFRPLSGVEYRQLCHFDEVLNRSETADQALDASYTAAASGLIGWRNMTDPQTKKPFRFNSKQAAKKLEVILTMPEAMELMAKNIQAQGLPPGSKKKLPSHLTSASGKSAKNAQGGKRARTRRRK